MLKISYTRCLGIFLDILTKFTLEMCFAARYHEKFNEVL